MASESFKHKPLTSPNHTIRVLDLLPSLDITSQISIKLREVSPDAEQLDFRALSYVWGDANDTTPIHIEGKALQVTRNCKAALKSLRQADKDISLWIDAVCVDQSNVSERSQQVALMGDIYGKAEGIVGFLGQATLEESNSSLPWEFLQVLASFEEDENETESKQFKKFYQEIVQPRRATWEKCCQDLKRIFEHPWWERLWIYQEIMLARQVQLVFGPEEILEWDVLEKAVQVMYKYTAQAGLWVQKDYLSDGDDNQKRWIALKDCGFVVAFIMAKDRKKCVREQESQQKLEILKERSWICNVEKERQDELWQHEVWNLGFSQLLPAMLLEQRVARTTHLKCSNSRDRIYATLAVVKTRSPFIVPDYSKCTRQVHHEFARALAPMTLEFMRDAGIGLTGFLRGGGPYPSWSPDWEYGTPPSRLSGVYSAAGNERTFAEVLEDGHTLRTAAYCIDEVEEVLSMPFDPSLSEDEFREILQSFQNTNTDWKGRKHMLVRTLTADTDECGRRLSQETVKEWTKAMLIWPSEYSHSDSEGDDSSEYDSDYDEDEIWNEEKEFAGFFAATTGRFRIVKMSKGRHFMRTTKGRMVLGPKGATDGDLIYVLPGCSVPLVFRREKEDKRQWAERAKYDDFFYSLDEDSDEEVDDENEEDGNLFLVGECFVYGMMDGEALKGADDGDVLMEFVTIR